MLLRRLPPTIPVIYSALAAGLGYGVTWVGLEIDGLARGVRAPDHLPEAFAALAVALVALMVFGSAYLLANGVTATEPVTARPAPLAVQVTGGMRWMTSQTADGLVGVRLGFASIEDDAAARLAAQVVAGKSTMPYTLLRACGISDPQAGSLRRELVEKGLAVTGSRSTIVLTVRGRKEFYRLAGRLPHPTAGARK